METVTPRRPPRVPPQANSKENKASDVKIEKEILNEDDETIEEVHVNEHTETINLDDKEEKEDNTVKVNFMDESSMENVLKNKTEQSKENSEKDNKKDPKTEQSSSTTKTPVEPSSEWTENDFADISETVIDVLDLLISTALRIYSKEGTATEFELAKDKKARLIRQLTKLMVKYNKKFSLEFMFVMTLLIVYTVPYNNARKIRKEVLAGTYSGPGRGRARK